MTDKVHNRSYVAAAPGEMVEQKNGIMGRVLLWEIEHGLHKDVIQPVLGPDIQLSKGSKIQGAVIHPVV